MSGASVFLHVAFLIPCGVSSFSSLVYVSLQQVAGFTREKVEAARLLNGEDQRWHTSAFYCSGNVTVPALTQQEWSWTWRVKLHAQRRKGSMAVLSGEDLLHIKINENHS